MTETDRRPGQAGENWTIFSNVAHHWHGPAVIKSFALHRRICGRMSEGEQHQKHQKQPAIRCRRQPSPAQPSPAQSSPARLCPAHARSLSLRHGSHPIPSSHMTMTTTKPPPLLCETTHSLVQASRRHQPRRKLHHHAPPRPYVPRYLAPPNESQSLLVSTPPSLRIRPPGHPCLPVISVACQRCTGG